MDSASPLPMSPEQRGQWTGRKCRGAAHLPRAHPHLPLTLTEEQERRRPRVKRAATRVPGPDCGRECGGGRDRCCGVHSAPSTAGDSASSSPSHQVCKDIFQFPEDLTNTPTGLSTDTHSHTLACAHTHCVQVGIYLTAALRWAPSWLRGKRNQ